MLPSVAAIRWHSSASHDDRPVRRCECCEPLQSGTRESPAPWVVLARLLAPRCEPSGLACARDRPANLDRGADEPAVAPESGLDQNAIGGWDGHQWLDIDDDP